MQVPHIIMGVFYSLNGIHFCRLCLSLLTWEQGAFGNEERDMFVELVFYRFDRDHGEPGLSELWIVAFLHSKLNIFLACLF